MTRSGWLGLSALALLAAAFAYANRGERAAVHLGVATFYQTPVTALVLGSFVGGMLAMFLLGLRHDLAVRKALRERAAPAPPAPDRSDPFPASYTRLDAPEGRG